MRAVITRVSSASVEIDGEVAGSIGAGLLILLGVAPGDDVAITKRIAEKICRLRIFEDAAGKMNLDLAATGGEILVISQFTLYADLKSRRPGFTGAAKPGTAIPLYELFVAECRAQGFAVQTGVFGADMEVASVNDGPVTIVIDSENF